MAAAVPDRGFLRDARGRYTTFRFPGARSTLAQKLNDRGQITGLYSNTTDDPRDGEDLAGFLRDARGRYTRIAVPGARTTTAVGINNRGQVVGQYQDANRRYHGYLWERGRFTTIDAPGAAGTSLTDINDRGQIVGVRLEPDGTIRGFDAGAGPLQLLRRPWRCDHPPWSTSTTAARSPAATTTPPAPSTPSSKTEAAPRRWTPPAATSPTASTTAARSSCPIPAPPGCCPSRPDPSFVAPLSSGLPSVRGRVQAGGALQ